MAANTYAPLGTVRHHPEHWKSGPDYVDHQKYYAWLKHKAQARFRDELYELTFEEWQSIWTDKLWDLRGRGNQDVCLCRLDNEGAWSIDNCHVITRAEQLKRNGDLRRGHAYGAHRQARIAAKARGNV